MIQDEVNNVIIFQPGTPGYEESEPVILQGHMDMVCEKTSESTHDFEMTDWNCMWKMDFKGKRYHSWGR